MTSDVAKMQNSNKQPTNLHSVTYGKTRNRIFVASHRERIMFVCVFGVYILETSKAISEQVSDL